MITFMLLVLAGLVILILAGDVLVRGAVNLSLRMGIPAIVVSLTVVAFGTSAPELIIAVQAALEGAPGIAFGNVVGSNIANVLLVLGVPAALVGLTADRDKCMRSMILMLIASVAFIFACWHGNITPIHGLLFLGFLAFVLWDSVRIGLRNPEVEVDEEVLDSHLSRGMIALFLVLGLVGLPLGAELLIRGAVGIAEQYGLPEAVIGLTIVAIGTSLPELATTVMAAYRQQADVALGNAIGSNLFNILAIMGVVALFGPLPVPPGILAQDLWVMLAAALVLVPFVLLNKQISRPVGAVLVLIYAVYITMIVVSNTGTA